MQAAALSILKAETRPLIIMSRTAPREPVIRWAHTLKVGGKLVRGQCSSSNADAINLNRKRSVERSDVNASRKLT